MIELSDVEKLLKKYKYEFDFRENDDTFTYSKEDDFVVVSTINIGSETEPNFQVHLINISINGIQIPYNEFNLDNDSDLLIMGDNILEKLNILLKAKSNVIECLKFNKKINLKINKFFDEINRLNKGVCDFKDVLIYLDKNINIVMQLNYFRNYSISFYLDVLTLEKKILFAITLGTITEHNLISYDSLSKDEYKDKVLNDIKTIKNDVKNLYGYDL